jgi:hypothetical protein
MRNLAPVLLSAATTAVGIFAYDTLRKAPEPAPSTSLPAADSISRDSGRDAARLEELERRMATPLQGAANEDALVRIAALERQVRALAAGGAAPATDGAPPARTALPLPAETTSGTDGASYDEQELARFRSVLDEVERRRRRESLVLGIRNQLGMQELKLTQDQEDLVVRETTKLRERVSEIWRNGARDERSRAENMSAMQKVREDWTKAIQEGLPAADAEKVISTMGRGMAMGMPGRLDGTGGPGATPTGVTVPAPPR